jgi:SpoVK/Ycf46/Vps4 family AAA+-type ATPase
VTCVTVSAKDVLLDEASSSLFGRRDFFDVGGVACGSGGGGAGLLLIIDDLDAVIGNADETGSSSAGSDLESEQLRALDAIVRLVDGAASGAPSRRRFVLGICRSPLSRFPHRLARVGRFEKEVVMSPPTLAQRRDIFQFWLSTLPRLDGGGGADGDATAVARWADSLAPRTAGCVAADIRRICADALTSAASRVPRTAFIGDSAVTWEDVKEAARTCVPSELSSLDVIPASSADYLGRVDPKREFESAWENFGGYHLEKKRIYRTVVRPWKYHMLESASLSGGLKDDAQSSAVGIALGLSKPSGVLFHGPSGCGKSMAALCLASSLGLHCVKVSDMPRIGPRSFCVLLRAVRT